MSKFIGRLVNVGVGLEDTRGTAATITNWIPKTSLTIQDKVTKIDDLSSINNITDAQDSDVIKKFAEGEIELPLKVNAICSIMYSLLGTLSSSTEVGTGAYSHVFSLANTNEHKSLTVAVNDEVQDFTFTNAMIDTFTLSINTEDYITTTIGIKAKPGVTGTYTPAYAQDYRLVGKHCTVKTATTVAGLPAANAIKVMSLELNVAKNLEEEYKLGSAEPVDFLNTELMIDGSVELLFENETYKDYDFDNTNLALSIDIVDAETQIATSGINPQFKIVLSKVNFREWTPAYDNGAIVKQSLNFKALVDRATGTNITSTVVNSQELA